MGKEMSRNGLKGGADIREKIGHRSDVEETNI